MGWAGARRRPWDDMAGYSQKQKTEIADWRTPQELCPGRREGLTSKIAGDFMLFLNEK